MSRSPRHAAEPHLLHPSHTRAVPGRDRAAQTCLAPRETAAVQRAEESCPRSWPQTAGTPSAARSCGERGSLLVADRPPAVEMSAGATSGYCPPTRRFDKGPPLSGAGNRCLKDFAACECSRLRCNLRPLVPHLNPNRSKTETDCRSWWFQTHHSRAAIPERE